jgi:hypothetical protein
MSYRIGDLLTVVLLCALTMGVLTNESFAQRRKAMAMEGVKVQDNKSKFVSLLENKDFSQFRGYASEEIPEGWEVTNKVMSFNGKGSGDVITKETFKDFELQVEWSIEKGGNSGIMFRVTLGDDQPYYSGPEFQILDDSNAGDGKNELTSAGALYDLYPAASGKKLNPTGKWNKSRIIVKENKVTHYLNGVKVVETEFGSDDWNERLAKSKFKDWEKFNKSEEGHIAFQNHGNPVRFRNIRIKRLGEETMEAPNSSPEQGLSPATPEGGKAPGRGGRIPQSPEGGGLAPTTGDRIR